MATGMAKKSTVWKGLTATTTAMECLMATAMEMAINGSTAEEGFMATAMTKKSTAWKGLTAMATAMEADGGLDGDGNGIYN